jgi:hypothetical protein
VDFADVRTVMREMGDAIMGSGIGRGEHRASVAAENAISSPLLEGVSIQGAQGVLVNITGGRSMSLLEVSEATQIIHDAAGDDANLIFGAVLDDSMAEEIMVTVIATGFNTRPKYTGLAYPGAGAVPQNATEQTRGRVERMSQPAAETMKPRETVSAAADTNVQLPKIERMYVPRGTLTEKDRPEAPRERATPTGGSPVRLTPKTETRHVPSGPRDLKDFDQPAYLRRGITLPPIDETEESESGELQPVTAGGSRHVERKQDDSQKQRDRDDRPTFLRRIMD